MTDCSIFQWINLPESRAMIKDYKVLSLIKIEQVKPPRYPVDIMLVDKQAENITMLNKGLNFRRHGTPILTFPA